MRFAAPEYLWGLLLLPLLILVLWLALALRRRALARFAGDPDFVARFSGEVSGHRRFAKALLVFAALTCGILALARPQWGTRMEPIRGAGVDVVVAVDTSLSMAAEDLAPSRFEFARHAVGDLMSKLGGNRIALVTFAGEASLVCPLTPDGSAVGLLLDSIDIERVQVPGTSLASALRVAIRAFGEDPGDDRGRALVLFTDGEDHLGALEGAREQLEAEGIVVFSVGVGTERGAPIPLYDSRGELAGYKKDREERVVTTRLDATALSQLADASDGEYFQASPAGDEIDDIARALNGLEQGETAMMLRRRYEDRFQWPLAAGLLLLLVETLIGDRKRSAVRRAVSSEGAR
ncbi:hypothetical protein ABI59_03610 [Acidobacteria bacterium Mor1]|nr:hypothetical protein ABI59_03610 [Acidobacteria bacterium Mor1]